MIFIQEWDFGDLGIFGMRSCSGKIFLLKFGIELGAGNWKLGKKPSDLGMRIPKGFWNFAPKEILEFHSRKNSGMSLL